MSTRRLLIAATLSTWAALACAEPPAQVAHGMTLYVYKGDRPGISACNAGCAKAFPPLEAPAQAKPHGDFGIVRREDGRSQWAFRGQPLYRFAGDGAPGQRSGENAGGVWSVVRLGGEREPHQSASDYAF